MLKRSAVAVMAACCVLGGVAAAEEATLRVTLAPDGSTERWRSGLVQVEIPPVVDAAAAQARRQHRRFAEDDVTEPQGWRSANPYVWKMVYLIYPSIDAPITVDSVTTQFTYTFTSAEMNEAYAARDGMIAGILTGSNGEARPIVSTVVVGRTLTQLASFGADYHWPDPAITAPELVEYAQGVADSVVIYWPARDPVGGYTVKTFWGLAYGRPEWWTYDVGYSTVASVVSPIHPGYYPGEVMIHEWLHPTSDYYDFVKGYPVPNLDAGHTYRPCPACAPYEYVHGDGWMAYYRDYMQGSVWSAANSRYEGIPPAAWRSGTPTNQMSVREWELFE